jgi:hypothetical protein
VRPWQSVVEIVLSTYAVLVFAILWIGVAIGIADGGRLLTDAWTRLTGLEVVAQVALWILFLPIAVLLWAWNSGLAAPFAWVVALGLLTWTLVALAGLARAFRGHPA